MRWKRQQEAFGTRERRGFLLIPQLCVTEDNLEEWRWLESATWLERHYSGSWYPVRWL